MNDLNCVDVSLNPTHLLTQKTPTQTFYDNFDERGPILIIRSLLHSRDKLHKKTE